MTVRLPPEYIQLPKYPGYYWNVISKQVYSCKTGELYPISKKKPYKGYICNGDFVDSPGSWPVSVFGARRLIIQKYIDQCVVKFYGTEQIFPERAV